MEVKYGEYYKLHHLGDGSFASVELVRHKDLNYVRALKICNNVIDGESDKKWLKFMKEAQLLLKIGNGGHPNIVKIYRPRLVEDRAIVEMDYIDGISLQDYIEQEKFLTFEEVWKFISNIVDAMAYCHVDCYKYLLDPVEDNLKADQLDLENGFGFDFKIPEDRKLELIKKYGVVHNDLHANNIMRRALDGAYVLLDFGLAIQNKQTVNSSNKRAGAIEYKAPEKFDLADDPDVRSDVYSLGVLLFKVLTGRVPFPCPKDGVPESQVNAVLMAHKNQSPPDILPLRKEAYEEKFGTAYHRDYPEAFDYIIMKCLAKRREDRYANAKELLKALTDAYMAFDEKAILRVSNESLNQQIKKSQNRNALLMERTNSLDEELSDANHKLAQADVELAKRDKVLHDTISQLDNVNKSAIKLRKRSRITIAVAALSVILLVVISAISFINTSGIQSEHIETMPMSDTVYVNNEGVKVHEKLVHDTVTIHRRDTVKVQLPGKVEYQVPAETVSELNRLRSENNSLKAQLNKKSQPHTKIEYKTPPDVMRELERLRAENRKLKGQVQRYRESLQQ